MTRTRVLDPAEAMALLARYGIPMPPQRLAADAAEAARAAEAMGGPVALKVAADGVAHKSDVGGVRLDLNGPGQVAAAFEELTAAVARAAPGARLRGALVQRMVAPGREVIVGVKRDPLFGPMVLVGLGGVWVELLGDVVLHPAPLDVAAARAMVARLRGARLLEGYRGQPPADVAALAGLVERVSRLAVEQEELQELDLNPVLVGPEGRGAVAVDARVVVGPVTRRRRPGRGKEAQAAIDRLLNPRSLAIIGASADPRKGGGRLLHYLQKHGYPGRIYPVNPGERTIGGLPAYPSVAALPETPDLACVMVPERAVAEVVTACAARGIRAAIVYTSGFGETGEEGRRREAALAEAARRAGLRLCGPNTVGVVNSLLPCCAAFGMAFEADRVQAGEIAFLTQSGALGGSLLSRCWAQGIGVGRWICTGNEADLTLADYLLYLADDPATRVIAAFVEAIRDPETFREACRRARAQGKPVVVYKTGRSAVGRRAVQSHTGALAGDEAVYDAVLRELGVVQARDLQALADAAQALAWQPLPRGRRMAVVSASGGACSVIADECARAGLELPPLREETRSRIARIIPPFGAAQNPVDVTMQVTVNPEIFGEVLDRLLDEPHIDGLLMMLTTSADPPAIEVARGIIRAAERGGKPVLVARTGAEFLAPVSLGLYREHRIPVYPMPDRAVEAMRAMVEWAGVR